MEKTTKIAAVFTYSTNEKPADTAEQAVIKLVQNTLSKLKKKL